MELKAKWVRRKPGPFGLFRGIGAYLPAGDSEPGGRGGPAALARLASRSPVPACWPGDVIAVRGGAPSASPKANVLRAQRQSEAR